MDQIDIFKNYSFPIGPCAKSLFVWVLWHINICRLFNAKSIFIQVNCSISNNSVFHKYTVLSSKIVLFQAIQFSLAVIIEKKNLG